MLLERMAKGTVRENCRQLLKELMDLFNGIYFDARRKLEPHGLMFT
jgi:hypothetical protein